MVVTPAIPIATPRRHSTASPPPGKAGLAGAPLAGPRINTDEQAVAWRRIVDFVHSKDAIVAARIATTNAVPGALEAAVERAAFAGFDLLVLDPGADDPGDGVALEHLPAMVQVARDEVDEVAGGSRRGSTIGRTRAPVSSARACRQLVRAGCEPAVGRSRRGDARMAGARLPAAPLADQLRNELVDRDRDRRRRDRVAPGPRCRDRRRARRTSSSWRQMPGGFTRRS